MALFVRQTDERSKLQEKLAAELKDKLRQQQAGSQPLDKMEDSSYLKDTTDSSPWAAVWLVVIVLGLVVLGVTVFVNAS